MHNKIYIAAMGLFTGAISFGTIFGPARNISVLENRVLEQYPNFTLAAYLSGEYQDSLEKALGDQFIYRDKIITVHENTKGKLLNIFDPVTSTDWDVEIVGDKYLWSNDQGEEYFTSFEHDLTESSSYLDYLEGMVMNNVAHIQQLVDTGVDVFFFSPPSQFDFANYNIHGTTTDDIAFEIIKRELSDSVNIIDAEVDYSKHDFYLYKSDHHLNTQGQLWHYIKLSTAFSNAGYTMDPQVQFGPLYYADHLKSRGTLTPAGYTGDVYDEVMFYQTIYSNRNNADLGVTWPDRCVGLDNPDYIKGYNLLNNSSFDMGEVDYYEYLFGCNTVRREFSFSDGNKDNLLVIGDSNFLPINIYFASNFGSTVAINNSQFNGNILEIIEEENIDVVLIDLQNSYYRSTLSWYN